MATVPIATYILKRITQLGVGHIQGTPLSRQIAQSRGIDDGVGVPGDMNLLFLDYIEDAPEVTWGTITFASSDD
jgi:TPP-dependent 2-oxoacid decarboxylase